MRDAARRARIAALHGTAWEQARPYAARADADISQRPDYAPMMRDVDHLARRLEAVPVLILASLDTRQLGPLVDAAGAIVSPLAA